MNALKAFNNTVNGIVTNIAAVLFVLMAAFVIIQVFSRYVLNYSVPWTEEYSRYLFIYVVLLGSSIAVKAKAHVAVGMFADRLGRRTRHAVAIFAVLVSCGFFLAMVYGSYYSMLIAAKQLSPATETNIGLVYFAAPLSGALMLLYSLEILFELLRDGPPEPVAETVESVVSSE